MNPYDTYMRSGAYDSGNPALPFTSGSDAAGVVESVGTDVDLTPGDRVYTSGTITGAYAELALCKRSQVHLLPACMNFSQGAGVYVPYATAYRACFSWLVRGPARLCSSTEPVVASGWPRFSSRVRLA